MAAVFEVQGRRMMEIRGLKELDEALRNLPEALQHAVLAPALRTGAEILQKGAAARAARERGKLAADILIDVHVEGAAGVALVGPSEDTAWRARFLEFGTAPHTIRAGRERVRRKVTQLLRRGKVALAIEHAKGILGKKAVLASGERIFGRIVKHPGFAARPFLRPALDEDGPRAVETFARRLWDGIELTVRKLRGA